MSRTKINAATDDLVQDAGSVLLSLIQGEQLEFPVNLNFLEIVDNTYTFEAALVEGLNNGAGGKPTTIAVAPDKKTLTVRIPLAAGIWDIGTVYTANQYVTENGLFYLLNGTATVGTAPSLDATNWDVMTKPNRVFIQLTELLSIDPPYAVQPDTGSPVYAFLELRVTEPANGILTRTWKPVRGLVEFLFSPTAINP